MSNKLIRPSKRLEKYLAETLRIEELKSQSLTEKQKAGLKLDRRIRNNDEKKVRMLDYLFRSMADLIYFFETVNHKPELIDKFGDDIEDLLGLNPIKPRCAAFERFIEAVIFGGMLADDYGKPEFAYRYRALNIMQSLIKFKVIPVYSKPDSGNLTEYTSDEARALIYERFLGIQAHVGLLERYWTKAVNQKGQIKKPTRQLGF